MTSLNWVMLRSPTITPRLVYHHIRKTCLLCKSVLAVEPFHPLHLRCSAFCSEQHPNLPAQRNATFLLSGVIHMTAREILHYFPPFLWKFWLSDTGQISHTLRDSRVHIYDVYENALTETRRIPEQKRSIFQDFYDANMSQRCKAVLQEVESTFAALEREAESTLSDLMRGVPVHIGDENRRVLIPMDKQAIDNLCTYLVFLRFRNSCKYADIVASSQKSTWLTPDDSKVLTAFRPFFLQIRRQVVLTGFLRFLRHSATFETEHNSPSHDRCDPFHEAINQYCWRFAKAEVCVGVAAEKQEFLLPECCFGTLDEGLAEDPGCCDLFFPIIPTFALYILADPDNAHDTPETSSRILRPKIWIECGLESSSDVHLRNAMVLQTYPHFLYFSSLLSVAQSISSYDEFRWIPEHLDYSRLRQRCRQKYTMEGVKKTLIVKGSVILTDLSDEVVRVGNSAVCHGSFSDVWMGVWNDPTVQKPRHVALKFLRQNLAQDVHEKLLKRLKDEVIAWHRLQHPNIARLYGVIQVSNTIAMVSPWCAHGTINHYLKDNPAANRLKLLAQVASGVAYLHNCIPVVVHGDLKGGNILIGDQEQALITDFGLSKVVEEMTDSINFGTSFFAGSTRWMAPELVLALVEDDGRVPPVTTQTDVYAFASVCLEIVTGKLPYPHRTNDHAVTVDILRGVRPSRGAICYANLQGKDEDAFWSMLDRCWEQVGCMRPTMSEITSFLEGLLTSSSRSV